MENIEGPAMPATMEEALDDNAGEFEEWEKVMINERLALADASPGASRPAKEVFDRLLNRPSDSISAGEHSLEKYAGTWNDPAMMELYRNSLAEYRVNKDRGDGIDVAG